MLPQRITLPSTHPAELNPFSTHSSGLFVHAKNLNPFEIKQIQTLSAKHPGWGYLCDNSGPSASLCPEPRRVRYHLPSFLSPLCFHILTNCPPRLLDFFLLCFHGLTNCFSRNSFPFTTICVAPWFFPCLAESSCRIPQNQVRRVGYPIAGHEPRVTSHVLLFRGA
jgi:hypothetical protein